MFKRYGEILGFSLFLLALLFLTKTSEGFFKEQEVMMQAETEEKAEYDLVYYSKKEKNLNFEVGALKKQEGEYYLFLPRWCRQEEGIELYAAQDLYLVH